MIKLFSIGLIICPMLIGTVLLVLMKHLSRLVAMRTGLVVMILATISAFGLTSYINQVIPFTLTWIPGTGSITLYVSATGIYAGLITTSSGLFALSISYVQEEHIHPATIGVMLWTLAAANVVLLSRNFLGRYVALEVVGGAVALLPFLAYRNAIGSQLSKFTYFIFRIGDAGLLTAILLLMHTSGTLDITSALDAAALLDSRQLLWVVTGFLLAVWVKIGVWPFHGWQRTGRSLVYATHAWAYASVMPNLGLYLLYRITPLLVLSPRIQQVVLLVGSFSYMVAMVMSLIQPDIKHVLTFLDAAQGALAICMAAAGLGSVVWMLLLVYTPLRMLLVIQRDNRVNVRSRNSRYWTAGFIGVGGLLLTLLNAILVGWLAQSVNVFPVLMTLLKACILLFAYRCIIALVTLWRQGISIHEANSGERRDLWIQVGSSVFLSVLLLAIAVRFGPLLRFLSILLNTEFPPLPSILMLANDWIGDPILWIIVIVYVIAERRHWLEANWGIRSVAQTNNLENSILTFAKTINKVIETQFLERIITRLPDALARTAAFLHQYVEVDGLEGFLHGVSRGANRLGRELQQWHTGRLRVNLSWVIILLLLVVSILILRSW